MATLLLSTGSRNAAVTAINVILGSAGTLKFYSGSMPADGDTDPAGTLLATVALASTPFGAASAGTQAMAAVAAVTIAASGTAAVAAFEASAGTNVYVCDVTATGGGGTITLDTVALSAGGNLQITSFSLTQPGS